jgi:pyruvate/2-oxoglutarate dehydrogenase complex dihydrolipoamide acyltransferase (E2) component
VPFHCEIRIEATHLGVSSVGLARLDEWLVVPGAILAPDTPIALLRLDGLSVELRIRFRCLVEDLVVSAGAQLAPGDRLLRVQADGEDLPTGFRYCTVRELQ